MGQVWRCGIRFCREDAEIVQGIEKTQIYFSAVAVYENSIPAFTAKCSNCDMLFRALLKDAHTCLQHSFGHNVRKIGDDRRGDAALKRVEIQLLSWISQT
jgi:hypothetical protein